MPYDVFISYSRRDLRIAQALESILICGEVVLAWIKSTWDGNHFGLNSPRVDDLPHRHAPCWRCNVALLLP